MRQALADANDGDTINFAVAGGNSITVYNCLSVKDQITIDGGGTQVVGSNGGIGFAIFVFNATTSNGSIIQNLAVIDGWYGLYMNNANNIQVLNCRIGTDWSDTDGVGNSQEGIRILNSSGTIIGAPGQGNVISANDDYGIYISDSSNITIQSNYLGTNSAGTAALSGQDSGVYLYSGNNITIGGDSSAGEGNVISGNTTSGLFIGSTSGTTTDVVITGNIIGLNPTRTAAIPNTRGILINQNATSVALGQALANYGNIIAGNTNYGVYLSSCSGNTVQNNLVGVTASNAAFTNGNYGIYMWDASNNIIGGRLDSSHFERNVIANHTSAGIYVLNSSDSNTISGNFIGTDINGTTAMSNSTGLRIDNGNMNLIGGPGGENPLTARGNIISGQTGNGIHVLGGAYTAFQGNMIGLTINGDTALANNTGMYISGVNDCTIGSPVSGAGNVISGNTQDGIYLDEGSLHFIVGNLFGTSLDGLTQISNGSRSIYASNVDASWFGGTVAGAGNLFTDDHYLSNDSDNNTVVGNAYGVLLNGTALPSPINTALDIGTNSDSNWIGLPSGGASNLIANANTGINMSGSAMNNGVFGNTVVGCSVPSNFMSGANQDKTSPTITIAFPTLVSGTSGNGDYIEVFKADRAAGFMGGCYGRIGYTTADGSGNWSVAVSGIVAGDNVTAMATDGSNNTSMFATNFLVVPTPSATPTVSGTYTPTPTATPTSSATSTITPTITPTLTPSATSTITPTTTPTPTITETSTQTPDYTSTPTATFTSTPTITLTVTPTSTATPTTTTSPVSGLDTVDLQGKIALAYPNPATDQVTFLFHLEQAADIQIRIFNVAGEQIAVIQESLSLGRGQTLVWNAQDVASGIYLVQIVKNGNVVETQRIAIVQ